MVVAEVCTQFAGPFKIGSKWSPNGSALCQTYATTMPTWCQHYVKLMRTRSHDDDPNGQYDVNIMKTYATIIPTWY